MITSLLACMLSCSCNPKLQFLRDNALLKDEYALDISDSITGCHSRFFFYVLFSNDRSRLSYRNCKKIK